jgi:hypothetical protein
MGARQPSLSRMAAREDSETVTVVQFRYTNAATVDSMQRPNQASGAGK